MSSLNDLVIAADKYHELVKTLEYSERMRAEAQATADKWNTNVEELRARACLLSTELDEAHKVAV